MGTGGIAVFQLSAIELEPPKGQSPGNRAAQSHLSHGDRGAVEVESISGPPFRGWAFYVAEKGGAT